MQPHILKVIEQLLGLARSVTQLLVGGDGVVEANNVRLDGHFVVIVGAREDDAGEGGGVKLIVTDNGILHAAGPVNLRRC